jgi:hypothetical protein
MDLGDLRLALARTPADAVIQVRSNGTLYPVTKFTADNVSITAEVPPALASAIGMKAIQAVVDASNAPPPAVAS